MSYAVTVWKLKMRQREREYKRFRRERESAGPDLEVQRLVRPAVNLAPRKPRQQGCGLGDIVPQRNERHRHPAQPRWAEGAGPHGFKRAQKSGGSGAAPCPGEGARAQSPRGRVALTDVRFNFGRPKLAEFRSDIIFA